jgi:hypothetical protein
MTSALPTGYRVWLGEVFARHQPAEIYIDSFPAGLLGEFCDFEFPAASRLFHLARLLRWQTYAKLLRGRLPQFTAAYRLEPLTAEHEDYLQTQAAEVRSLELTDPPHELNEEVKQAAVAIMRSSVVELLVRHPQASGLPLSRRPIWLIVHSGSEAETAELIAYAAEMSHMESIEARLILIAPKAQTPDSRLPAPDSGLPTGVERFDFYPAAALFPIADRIITGCGFNSMRQTENYREKHRFIPFSRRFDNQFLRARRRQTAA